MGIFKKQLNQPYEGHQDDRKKVFESLGGTQGLIDSGIPSIVFLISFLDWSLLLYKIFLYITMQFLIKIEY